MRLSIYMNFFYKISLFINYQPFAKVLKIATIV